MHLRNGLYSSLRHVSWPTSCRITKLFFINIAYDDSMPFIAIFSLAPLLSPFRFAPDSGRIDVFRAGEGMGIRLDAANGFTLVRGNLTGWLGTIISKAVWALAARLVQRQRIFVTTPWLCLLVLCLCVYISALSGSTLVCRVFIFLELSEVPLFEPVA